MRKDCTGRDKWVKIEEWESRQPSRGSEDDWLERGVFSAAWLNETIGCKGKGTSYRIIPTTQKMIVAMPS